MSRTKNIFFLFTVSILLTAIHGCAFISIPLTPPIQPLQEEFISGTGDNKILIIDISGIISEKERSGKFGLSSEPNLVSRIKEELEKASHDPQIKAVILKINSPGGTVTASDIIHNEMIKFREMTGVKIIAAMMDIAASGGYYVASAADKIIAHPTTITGSIGVIVINLKIFELMNKIGIKNETIKSGSKKDLLSPFRPLTEEERKIMQGVIDTLYDQFVMVVAKGRDGLNTEQVKKIADGRIYTAIEALKLNLIDRIGYIDDAIEMAKKEANLTDAKVVRYNRPFTYKTNIYSTSPNIPIFNIGDILNQLTPKFMYIWIQ